MKIKYLMLVYLFFLNNAYCLQIYDRSIGMPAWEQNCLNQLAITFDGNGSSVGRDLVIGQQGHFVLLADQFVQQFINCTRGGAVEYLNVNGNANMMNPILLDHAKNPIGRELMYRIIAKLEPRIMCVNSIKTIISTCRNMVNLPRLFNICANFLVQLGAVNSDSIGNCNSDLMNISQNGGTLAACFASLVDAPRIFNPNSNFTCNDGSGFDGNFFLDWSEKLNKIIDLSNCHEAMLRTVIDQLRFTLVFDQNGQDHFDRVNNEVMITGSQDHYYNSVTGPLLTNNVERTHVETRWTQMSQSEILNHELSHYLRIGLEGFIDDKQFLLESFAFFAFKSLSDEHIMHLVDTWDSRDELTAIFGIRCSIQNAILVMMYDRLNESEYNLAEIPSRGIRYSHKNMRFPLIPYHFFDSVFRRYTGLPILYQTEIAYDENLAR